jgi:hypothetical protein
VGLPEDIRELVAGFGVAEEIPHGADSSVRE